VIEFLADPLDIIDLSKYTGDDEVVSSEDLYEILQKRKEQPTRLYTPFPTMTKLISGFYGGELVVISGLTKHGKTLLAQTITNCFAGLNQSSLWFTYEVPVLQFLSQFGQPLPHFFMPKTLKNRTLDWIHERVKEAKLKFNIQAVFIDHLHFLADIMIARNPSLQIGQLMRTLKIWALELGIVVFIIAHTGKITPGRELDTGDTRDSSFIEQEADNVFYIWRRTNDGIMTEDEAVVKITANRRFGIMGKKIFLKKVGNFLQEITTKVLPDEEDEEDDFGQQGSILEPSPF